MAGFGRKGAWEILKPAILKKENMEIHGRISIGLTCRKKNMEILMCGKPIKSGKQGNLPNHGIDFLTCISLKNHSEGKNNPALNLQNESILPLLMCIDKPNVAPPQLIDHLSMMS